MKFPYPKKHEWIYPFKLHDIVLLVFRSESTWMGFDKNEISLYQNSKGEFYLKGQPVREPRLPYYNENPNPIREVRVSKGWVCYLFKRLENARIPIFPAPQDGADGGFMELDKHNPDFLFFARRHRSALSLILWFLSSFAHAHLHTHTGCMPPPCTPAQGSEKHPAHPA